MAFPAHRLPEPVRDGHGATGFDDLTLLLVAILAFSLFFGSLAAAFVSREARQRGERLEALANDLLAAILGDPRWTRGHGIIDGDALQAAGEEALRPVAENHPFEIVLWNLAAGTRLVLAEGERTGDRRVAASAANLLGAAGVPARVSATVWGR